jgi:hypothetical protein
LLIADFAPLDCVNERTAGMAATSIKAMIPMTTISSRSVKARVAG